MSQRRTTSSLIVAAAVLGLVLAGCSDRAAEPQPLRPSSAPTSASPKSTDAADVGATLPSMPTVAKGTSAASAKEFVRHWIAVLNYSGPAGESVALRQLSSPRCLDCDAITDAIDRVSRNRGSISGRGWTLVRTVPLQPKREDWFRIRALVLVNTQTVVLKAGGKPRKFAGGRSIKTFDLAPKGKGWVVRRLEQGSI